MRYAEFKEDAAANIMNAIFAKGGADTSALSSPDADTGSSDGGFTGTNNAKEAVAFFVSNGFTKEQAAGIVGNLQAESGVDLNTGARGDGGQAYGIAQWHPDRQAKFKQATGRDINGSSLQDQLKFVLWELNNTERNAMSRLKSASSAGEAASIMDQYYERSSGAHRQKRIALATNLAKTTDIA